MAACESTRATPDDEKPEEKPDQEIITGELQSDFLELGPQAGVQWLSFYPDDFLEYPELFEGLDADQRRRTRLAPREGANKVLLKFDLPAGAKIKPVDWYGTECVGIDFFKMPGFTVALSLVDATSDYSIAESLRAQRTKKFAGKAASIWEQNVGADGSRDKATTGIMVDGKCFGYAARTLKGKSTNVRVIVECTVSEKGVPEAVSDEMLLLLDCISIVRELALEGSPKHQCHSTLDDLKAGIVAYEKGGLKLALPEGWELRKSGGSSTVEIHGGGAKPLALIRKLKSQTNGTFKARISADTVFARRRARPDGFFTAGRALSDKEPYVIAFDYKDKSQEQVSLCVISTGNELLTVEIISTGVTEGEARRKLRDLALDMLAKAEPSAIVRNSVPELGELVGWKPKE